MNASEEPSILNTACCIQQQNAGYLRLAGKDRAAFLQRQTTNDVALLEAGKAPLTVLTSPTARILDLLYLLEEPGDEEGAIGILTLAGHPGRTFQFLKSRIFFMDQVTLEDLTSSYVQIDLLGSQAIELLQRLEVPVPPKPGEVILGNLLGTEVRILGHLPQAGLGFCLIAPASSHEDLLATMTAAGAQPFSPEAYEIARVEAGLPAGGHELTEEFTPLETNLGSAISGSKGCYTGQEVIARQITYDKITRSLTGLRLEKPVEPGAALEHEGKPVGTVTSAVIHPNLGPIALAVIKRPYHTAGQSLTVGKDVRARTIELPFTKEE